MRLGRLVVGENHPEPPVGGNLFHQSEMMKSLETQKLDSYIRSTTCYLRNTNRFVLSLQAFSIVRKVIVTRDQLRFLSGTWSSFPEDV